MKKEKLIQLESKLTPRELEVSIFMSNSVPLDEISQELSMSESTTRGYASNVFSKLGLKNQAEFVAEYQSIEDSTFDEEKAASIEERIGEMINLTWDQNNENGDYYEEFSDVITAMCQLDFSKRLKESNNKNSLINFIAQSLNMVNDELEFKYMNSELIPKVLDLLTKRNRMVLLSKNQTTISHYYDTVSSGIDQGKSLIGQNINAFINPAQLQLLSELNSVSYTKDFQNDNLVAELNGKINISAEVFEDHLILVIDLSKEKEYTDHLPRILTLLSCIKSQYDDNPELAGTVLGRTVSTEINSIFKEFDQLKHT